MCEPLERAGCYGSEASSSNSEARSLWRLRTFRAGRKGNQWLDGGLNPELNRHSNVLGLGRAEAMDTRFKAEGAGFSVEFGVQGLGFWAALRANYFSTVTDRTRVVRTSSRGAAWCFNLHAVPFRMPYMSGSAAGTQSKGPCLP